MIRESDSALDLAEEVVARPRRRPEQKTKRYDSEDLEVRQVFKSDLQPKSLVPSRGCKFNYFY